MIKDATLERIWEAQRRIYERCSHDTRKIGRTLPQFSNRTDS